MDIKQLKYFLQICKCTSFSDASKKLYITQQGLSKSIKNLEEEFGFPLFYRNGGGIKLTKYGLYLKDNSAHVVAEFDCLINSITKMSKCDDSKLKLGYSLGTINALSYDFINNFRNNYPDIELSITEYQDFLCEEAVFSEEIDIGCTIGPVDKTKFDSKTISLKKLCVIVSTQNKLSKGSEINLKAIQNQKFIIPNKDYKIHHNFMEMCRKAGFEPNIVFTTADLNLIPYLCSVTNVLGIGTYFKDTPGVSFLPFKNWNSNWEVCFICKKGIYNSKYKDLFWNYILNLN